LLAGAELGRQSTDVYRNTAYFNNTSTSVNVPVEDPLTTGTPVSFRQSATDADAHTTALVASGYLQDQVQLFPGLLAVLGARLDNFDLQYHNNRTNSSLARTDQVISPRLGLVYKPVTAVSVYGSYSESFLPSSGSLFTSLNVTTQTLEPERFTNYELGAKWEPRPDVSLAASLYQLDRTNTSAPDPLDPSHTIQTGAQRSKGFELSAAGRVTRAWEVLAGYTYSDVKITSRTNAAQVSAVPALAPKHTLSVWNKYQFAPAVGAGIGLLHQASMFAAVDDAVRLPSFSRMDAAVFFRLNRRVNAQINVENIFNTRYYSTANSNNNITPGSPRSLRVGLTLGH
jgi:catecholate siderophore receptor